MLIRPNSIFWDNYFDYRFYTGKLVLQTLNSEVKYYSPLRDFEVWLITQRFILEAFNEATTPLVPRIYERNEDVIEFFIHEKFGDTIRLQGSTKLYLLPTNKEGFINTIKGEGYIIRL